jgi:hypothetical protein
MEIAQLTQIWVSATIREKGLRSPCSLAHARACGAANTLEDGFGTSAAPGFLDSENKAPASH